MKMLLTFALLLTASLGSEKPNSRRARGCCSRRSKDRRGLIERSLSHPLTRLAILALTIPLHGIARAEDQPLAMTTTTSTTTTPPPVDRYLDPTAGIMDYWSGDFMGDYGSPAREYCESTYGNIHDLRDCMNEQLAQPLKCIDAAEAEWRALGNRRASVWKHELRMWIQERTKQCVEAAEAGVEVEGHFVKDAKVVEVLEAFEDYDDQFVAGEQLHITEIRSTGVARCRNTVTGDLRDISQKNWNKLKAVPQIKLQIGDRVQVTWGKFKGDIGIIQSFDTEDEDFVPEDPLVLWTTGPDSGTITPASATIVRIVHEDVDAATNEPLPIAPPADEF